MGQSYEKNKVHIYNWISKNKEKVNEYSRKRMKQNYVPILYYKYETACKRLRDINY